MGRRYDRRVATAGQEGRRGTPCVDVRRALIGQIDARLVVAIVKLVVGGVRVSLTSAGQKYAPLFNSHTSWRALSFTPSLCQQSLWSMRDMYTPQRVPISN